MVEKLIAELAGGRELIAQAEALEWVRNEVVPCNLQAIRLTITDRIMELYRQANSPAQAEQPAEPVAVDKKRETQAWRDWAWKKDGEPVGLQQGQIASLEAWMTRASIPDPRIAALESIIRKGLDGLQEPLTSAMATWVIDARIALNDIPPERIEAALGGP